MFLMNLTPRLDASIFKKLDPNSNKFLITVSMIKFIKFNGQKI
ncbi:hypothetical protein CLU96_2024 [Chryseobacterium sp. 52]|nr:hypothetical protein CLU96_2024 [Chryseobacterium sp. 52]